MSPGPDFSEVFEQSPNPYMILDRDLRYVAVNAAYVRVTGVERDHLIGRPLFEVFPNDPDNPNNESATRLRQSLIQVLRTGRPDVLALIPYRVPRDSDPGPAEIRYWSASHTPIRGTDGEVAFVLQHTVDVTELHLLRLGTGTAPLLDEPVIAAAGVLDRAERVQEANRALRRAQAELQARADLERQLIGIVSHDLRNPLNAIGIGASLLRASNLDAQQRKVVDRMMTSFERAARLIRDFLDFTQARVTGRIPVSPSRANIREIAQAVCDEIQPAYPDRSAIVEHTGDEVGEWDPDRLSQLIGNLISNAFQHSPPGGTVTIRTLQQGQDVVLSVHNDGAPIPESDRARLFQPYERGTGSVTSRERSVGLGLFIVRAIVTAHNGSISVRSSRDDGTTFVVSLPYATIGGSTSPR